MAEWTIYGKNGTAKASVRELELHDEWMAECFITVSVKSAAPIDFSVGDYIDYRNERYSINYDPSKIKKARRNTYGEGFVYDNIKFVAVQDELVRCDFCDIVLSDNQMHYTQLPTFPFYCETVDDLLDRIQANMEDLYPGQWIIIGLNTLRNYQRGNSVGRAAAFDAAYRKWIDPTGASSTDPYGKQGVALTAADNTCWDALKMVHDDFELNFIVRDRIVIVGTAGVFTANTFQYGKGNGLTEIEVIGDSEQKVITRLRAYGAETNLPLNYYANLYQKPIIYGKRFMYNQQGYISYHIGTEIRYNDIKGALLNAATNIVVRYGNVSAIGNADSTTYDGTGLFPEPYGTKDDGVLYLTVSLWHNEQAEALYNAIGTDEEVKIYVDEGVNKSKWPQSLMEDYGNYPALLVCNRLMLPGFPDVSLDAWVRENRPELIDDGYEFSTDPFRPYIDSPNKSEYGLRPSNIYFDGSDETDDIHPTIEGMTWEGASCDVVVDAQQITDNGVLTDDAKESDKRVTIIIPNAGFALDNEWTESATINMKDGMCGARDFKILKKPKLNTEGHWECVCERAYDDTLHLYFPYSDFQIHTGDHFVLTGIELPDSYVEAASIRLFDAAMDALAKNELPRSTYQPHIDEIWMQRQHDRAVASQGTVSLHDTLKAGDIFSFADSDLGIDEEIIIDILTIKERGDGIPTYELTLRNEKQVSGIQRIAEKISSGFSSINGGGGGAFTSRQISSLITKYGDMRYLLKIDDDTEEGFITFLKGQQIGERFTTGLLGEGGVFRKDADGTTYLEADKLYIRMKAYFDTVEIREYIHSGGNRIASVAGVKCVRVEWIGANGKVLKQKDENKGSVVKFRCYFRGSDDEKEITNDFVVGDQAYCHITNVESHSSLYQHHFWRLVIGKSTDVNSDGEHYIDLSNVMSNTIKGVAYAGYQNGSDIPVPQDDIIQLGNVNDGTRRGAIIEFVSGENAPSYQIFQDLGKPVGTTIEEKQVSQYSLENKNFISLGYNSSTSHAYMNVYGDAYIGDGNRTTYIEYKQDDGTPQHNPVLNIKARINASSTIDDKSLQQFIQDSYDDTDIINMIKDVQEQIDGELDTYYMEGTPSLTKPPVKNTSSTSYDDPWLDGTETEEEKKKILNDHVGDLYYNKTNGDVYRFVYDDSDKKFKWTQIHDDAISEALRIASDAQYTADGKSTIFLNNPNDSDTSKRFPKNYKFGDMWILPVDATINGIAYKQGEVLTTSNDSETYKAAHWSKRVRYTDDSAFNGYINAILNGTGSSGNAATVAAAQKAIKDALVGETVVEGGLILSSLIAMRKYKGTGDKSDVANYNTWAGISGVRKDTETGTGWKGYGIAAWFGGAMIDHEVSTTATDYAKSLFRFDGSGYLASGNVSWDKNGIVTIANVYSKVDGENIPWSGTSLQYINQISTLLPTKYVGSVAYIDPKTSFTKLQIVRDGVIGNTDVLTYGEMKERFVPIGFFNALFAAFESSSSTAINPSTWTASTVIDNLKVKVGLWTEQYISALGLNSSGGGGGGASSLAQLEDVEINSPTVNQVLTYSNGMWRNMAAQSGTDMATVWNNLADNTTEQINQTHLTTALNGYATQTWVGQQGYLTSSSLSGYLPKSGGQMTGPLTWKNSTALPAKTSVDYVLTIDAFADGGKTYYCTIANLKTSLGLGAMAYKASLAASDIPNLSADKITSGTLPIARGGTGETTAFAAIENLGGLSLASRGTNIPDEANLNTYTTAGKYYCSNATHAKTIVNSPTTGSGFTLIVYINYATTRVIQKAYTSNFTTRFRYTDDSGSTWSAWKTFAYTDSDISGNAATATALANSSLTIWGQSFNGTASVSGSLTGVTTIDATGNITINRNATTATYVKVQNTRSSIALEVGSTTALNRGVYDSHTSTWLIYTNSAGNTLLPIGNVGIGTTSPSYKLHVSGDIYATGGVTSLSDSRYKNVISKVELSVEQIAKMPAVRYKWKNGGENTHIGTLAQDWQKVLPEAVLKANDEKGTLSIQYGVAALVSSIITARKVVDHEKRIAELERENKKLKMKLREG